MNAQSHIERIKAALASNPTVTEIAIVQEYALQDRGFLRVRLALTNGDFVEVSEFFVIIDDRVRLVEYRHQWMDSTRQSLRKRWDNAPHYPGLPNYPHHIHVGEETHVKPGDPLSILDVVDIIAKKIAT